MWVVPTSPEDITLLFTNEIYQYFIVYECFKSRQKLKNKNVNGKSNLISVSIMLLIDALVQD